MKKILLLAIVIGLFISNKTSGQSFFSQFFHENMDTVYYDKLSDLFTLRVFTAQKFSEFTINDNRLNESLYYNSNPKSAIGLGFSHKWLNLNLALGLQPEVDSTKGKTHRFDLNLQVFLRKISIGFYATISDGSYLANSQELVRGYSAKDYYRRPDIKNTTFGLSSSYVFNSEKYSNRATFVQNEWQKKTAGTLITGGNIAFNQISGDSSLVPSKIIDTTFLNGFKLTKLQNLALGADLGYTFTLVAYDHWFFDFAIIGGITLAYSKIESPTQTETGIKPGLNLTTRFGAGYNSKLFYAGINYSNLQGNIPFPISKMGYGFGFGKIQLTVAYRFKVPREWDILPKFSM